MLHPPTAGPQYTYQAHDRPTLLSEIAADMGSAVRMMYREESSAFTS